MPDLLLSGPAGSNKSAAAREALREMGLAVAADFQSIHAALTLATRDEHGRYPLRDERLLPLTEYVRRSAITGARNADIGVVLTNSDGDPARREFLLGLLGPGAVEQVIDPGVKAVKARLADPVTHELSIECGEAVDRWYLRI